MKEGRRSGAAGSCRGEHSERALRYIMRSIPVLGLVLVGCSNRFGTMASHRPSDTPEVDDAQGGGGVGWTGRAGSGTHHRPPNPAGGQQPRWAARACVARGARQVGGGILMVEGYSRKVGGGMHAGGRGAWKAQVLGVVRCRAAGAARARTSAEVAASMVEYVMKYVNKRGG